MKAITAIGLLGMLGLGFAIGTYRERSILLPRMECAYHEGNSDGYTTAKAEVANHKNHK